jgi:tetratricopeptide (TPR) repeat protein
MASMDGANEIGSRLRAKREGLGLSQAALGGKELSDSYVSLIESGRRTPSDGALRVLASRLSCSVEWLRTGRHQTSRDAVELRLREGELNRHVGEPSQALEIALALLSDDDLPPDLRGRARRLQGQALESLGRLEQAIDVFSDQVEEAGRRGERPSTSLLIDLSRCLREAGDLGAAVEAANVGLRRLESDGIPVDDAYVELAATLVVAYNERGDRALARRLIERTLRSADLLGSPRARGSAYWNAMLVAANDGRLADARRYGDTALALYGETDGARNLARLKVAYAWLLLRQDPPEPTGALSFLERADAELAEVGSLVDRAYLETERARALLLLGQLAEAEAVARSARARLAGTDVPGPIELARSSAVLAMILLRQGDPAAALELVNGAAAALRALGATRGAAEVWRDLGECARAAGELTLASTAFRHALDSAGIAPCQSPAVVQMPETAHL